MDLTLTALVIVSLLLLLIFSRLNPAWIFSIAVAVLTVGGAVPKSTIIYNMTNPSILILIGLILASFALEKTRFLPWLSTKIFSPSYSKTILKLGISAAFSSAFLNNTGVVAAFMGAVRRNQEFPASRLLIPLSYFAILGGTVTLIGTSTNLVVDGLLRSMALPGLSFGDFWQVGLLLVLVCGALVCVLSPLLKIKQSEHEISENYFIDAEVQPLSTWQNLIAIWGFVAAIGFAAFNVFPLFDAIVAYLFVMLISKVISGTTIRRRFPFDLWVILVCALSIASAFQSSGLSTWLSAHIVALLGDGSPMMALILLFVVTVFLTEIITNSAAAAIMLPIGISFATAYQVDMMPFVMCVAYAASASFMSPYGYQTNLMVMNAGGYRFGDFLKFGWPLTLIYGIVALTAIPYFFPF